MLIALPNEVTDLVISIRTLHHIQEPNLFFSESHRVLKSDGYFIFEIPNQKHLLNRIRYFLGRLSQNPYGNQQLKLGQAYYNFNPSVIESTLVSTGFKIIDKKPLSFFRSGLLKKVFSFRFLSKLDLIFQSLFSSTLLTPSILVMCKKNR